ncbi:MAG: YncE family protein, partial [Burkholderiales bacterium]|nr:YncE family protein [Burkholderiales bacterium]
GETRWDYVYMDSAAHRLYVSHATQTEVIDTQTDKLVGTIKGTTGVHGIAVASDLGLGFTSNGKDNAVTVFDLKSLETRDTIKVGTNPDAIVYEPASHRVVTFNGRSKDATIVDAKTRKVLGTVAVGGKPEFAQVAADGKVYFNIEDTNELAVLDVANMKLTQRTSVKPCESPSGLAMDDKQRLYSVCENGLMVITGTDGKQIGQAPIGDGPDGVAWLDGYAFSANGKDGTLSVVGEVAAGKFDRIETLATAMSARTIAVDPATHKLYLPAADYKLTVPGAKRETQENSFHVIVMAPQ